jgi:hypothetical protein
MKKTVLAAIVLAAAPALADAQVCTQHTYLGNRPDEGNPGWHEEAQGLAHDADNWYVSQNPGFFVVGGTIQGGPKLWRIPVTHDLADGVDCGDTGVSCKRLFDTPLFGLGYNHYGDIDFFQTGGRSFLVVPIEGGDPGPAMAFFRGDDTLEFLGLAPVAPQGKSSWVAVDPVRRHLVRRHLARLVDRRPLQPVPRRLGRASGAHAGRPDGAGPDPTGRAASSTGR